MDEQKNKNVLILTYYWPPSGGAGVQRWLKIVKYLRHYGWEPVIYTAKNPEYPVIDNSLQKDIPENILVIKYPVWEPYKLYRKLSGTKKNETVNQGFISETKKGGFRENISLWIRGNLFIPDARKYWIKPSIKFLVQYLKEKPADAIISSGPPHTMHLIALGLKKKLNLKWIADFRDPWTNIDFYEQLKLSERADKKHKQLEKEVLLHADKIVTVSKSWANDFKKISGRDAEVITNGYDEDDFKPRNEKLVNGFLFHHAGALNKDRNPHVFWEALKELCNDSDTFKNDIKIKLTGKNDFTVLESIEKNNLSYCLQKIEYLPHAELVKLLCLSPVLLLPLNNTPNISGIIPGKLFEYLAAKRPIFCIGNIYGDTAQIINETNAGVVVDFYDKIKMKENILLYYNAWKKHELNVYTHNVEQYTRRGSAAKFASLLNSITGGK